MDGTQPNTVRVAKVLGLATTGILCGKAFAQSYSTTPALLLAPAPLLARQWRRMISRDSILDPALAILSGSIFGYLGFIAPPSNSSSSVYYKLSTLCTLATIPFAYFTTAPLNRQLESKAQYSGTNVMDTDSEIGVKREETVHYQVDRWALVNLGKAVLLDLAVLSGFWGATR